MMRKNDNTFDRRPMHRGGGHEMEDREVNLEGRYQGMTRGEYLRGMRDEFPKDVPGESREGVGHPGHFETQPHHPGEPGRSETQPFHPGEPGRFETQPHRPDMHGRFEKLPAGPHGARRGRPPFGGPGFPHLRPAPEVMRERIEEGELAELMELAGRMLRHRPDGDAARGQNLILSILAGRETLSQRELQQMLGIQPGSLSEILSKLERKGQLQRERDTGCRGNRLRITDAGRQAVTASGGDGEGNALFSALTAEQQSQLCELLRTLLLDWVGRFDRGPRERRLPGPSRPAPLPAGAPGNDLTEV